MAELAAAGATWLIAGATPVPNGEGGEGAAVSARTGASEATSSADDLVTEAAAAVGTNHAAPCSHASVAQADSSPLNLEPRRAICSVAAERSGGGTKFAAILSTGASRRRGGGNRS